MWQFATVHPFISGAVVLVLIALAVPATRNLVIDSFIALVNKLGGKLTTDTQRRAAGMQRGIAKDERTFAKAKATLDEAKLTVQNVAGAARTALRHAQEADAAVTAAEAEVARVGKHVENKVVGPEALVNATNALTDAENAQKKAHAALDVQKKAADLAEKRLGDARAAVAKFKGTIDDEKANAELANSLNMTNDLTNLVKDINGTLSSTHAEAIQQEVDRAMAGIDQGETDEDKMKAAEAQGNAEAILARVRAKQSGNQ